MKATVFTKGHKSTRAHRHVQTGSEWKGGGVNLRKGAIIIVLLSMTIAGCAAGTEPFTPKKPGARILWTHRYQYVRLESRERCGHETITVNAHPATLARDDLTAALAMLRIHYPDEEKSVPVFSRQDLEILIDPLVKAFELATQNEDIALAIEGAHPSPLGFQRTITTARLFLQGKGLHLVFGKLHDPIDDYDSPLHMAPTDRRVKPFEPGSRCLASGGKFPTLLATDNVHFFEQEKAVRKNWLVIGISGAHQLEKTSGTSIIPTSPRLPAEKRSPTTGDSNQTPERMMPAIQTPKGRSVEEKLQILKKLREKDLITDQEYQEKKREILDSL